MTVAWLLIAVAVACWPDAARARVVQRRASPAALRLIVGASAGVLAVAVAGLPQGVVVAAFAVPASVALVSALLARPARVAPDPRTPRVLDLVAAALRAGASTDGAVLMAAPAAGLEVGASLRHVAGLLRLGADPRAAWHSLADRADLRAVAIGAGRSAHSGARLASTLEQLADDLRAQLRAAAEARAHRAGVLAIAPLGLCFLPAFACLGVIPVVIGVARGVSGVVP